MADLGGRARRTPPPTGPDFFISTYKIFEIYPPRESTPPLWGPRPPYGKSWIRHCSCQCHITVLLFVHHNQNYSVEAQDKFYHLELKIRFQFASTLFRMWMDTESWESVDPLHEFVNELQKINDNCLALTETMFCSVTTTCDLTSSKVLFTSCRIMKRKKSGYYL